MDEFTPEFIAEQLALAAKATPRPWVAEWDWEHRVKGNTVDFYEGWAETPTITGDTLREVEPQANADRLYMEAAANNYPAALEEIARLREAQRWIPVNERLPEDMTEVLALHGLCVTTAKYYHYCGLLSKHGWYQIDGMKLGVSWATHWMPLPEPPQEAEG